VDKEKTMPKPLWHFLKYATVPVVNMEGPPVTLQSLADAITMEEFKTDHRPRGRFILGTPKSTH
jgi:N-succinyl-L-ornithine transcarbamylase